MRSRRKPVNVQVDMGGKIRTIEQLMKAFKRAVKEDGILKEVKDRVKNYKTRGQRRRAKKKRGKLRESRNNISRKQV